MWNVKVGDVVTCIDTKWVRPIRPDEVYPQIDEDYTVREIIFEGGICFRFEEIQNKQTQFQALYGEIAFHRWHFRKKLTIEMFCPPVGLEVKPDREAFQEVEKALEDVDG